MRLNPQKSTESTPEIEPEQAEVITALVRGATITDATRRANVDRSAFYLWLKSDAAFEAELNRAKREHRDAKRLVRNPPRIIHIQGQHRRSRRIHKRGSTLCVRFSRVHENTDNGENSHRC